MNQSMTNQESMSITGFLSKNHWTKHGKEVLVQFRLAWPICVAMFLQYILIPISISFCGHLGKTELAAICMAMSVIYILVTAVGRGLAFGGATFFAQTYGSDEKKNVGIYLQKGIIFTVLWSLPIGGILLNVKDLLILLGQNPDVARLAQVYINYFLPGTWAYYCLLMLLRYLICQNKVYPGMIVSFLGCAINVALSYGLVYKAGLGIRGSAVALCLTYYLQVFMIVGYFWGTSMYKETWTGWSFHCLEKWGEFSRLTSFSVFLGIVYWTATEIGTYTSGTFGATQLSAFAISFQMEPFSLNVFAALSSACSTRMGQFLGANKPKSAAHVVYVGIISVFVISIVFAVLCYTLSHYIPQIFTTDKSVIDLATSLLKMAAVFVILEGIGIVGMGIVRGVGKQATGTIVILIAWFAVAWPIGLPLMFLTQLQILGLWTSFIIGILFQDIFLVIFLLKVDWNKQAEEAVKRANIVGEKQSETKVNESSKLIVHSWDSTKGKRYDTTCCEKVVKEHQEKQCPKSRKTLVIKRLLILGLFALPLVVGIVTRLTIKVEVNSFIHSGINTTMSPYISNVTQYDDMTTQYFVY